MQRFADFMFQLTLWAIPAEFILAMLAPYLLKGKTRLFVITTLVLMPFVSYMLGSLSNPPPLPEIYDERIWQVVPLFSFLAVLGGFTLTALGFVANKLISRR